MKSGGPNTASTSAFAVINSASTTEFSVYDTGNAILAGGLTQNSDQRLKTSIQSLGASSSLSAIDSLNPVTFNWIDPEKGTEPQLGFIAQQVLPIFPNLVSTTSPTALTPDGTLSLNYIGLIAPIVSAIQALDQEVTNLANKVAGFADAFTTNQLTFVRGQGHEIDAQTANIQTANIQTLCIGSTCVTETQLQALLAAADQRGASAGATQTSSPEASQATNTPPVIQIKGDNPSIVQVGAVYSDLGATITGPTDDLNLGIATYLNGTLTSDIVIDTTEAATDSIDYVATDQNGLTATSTRTVHRGSAVDHSGRQRIKHGRDNDQRKHDLSVSEPHVRRPHGIPPFTSFCAAAALFPPSAPVPNRRFSRCHAVPHGAAVGASRLRIKAPLFLTSI